MIPEDLRYTQEHEWIRDLGDGLVRVGITDHAQNALGDIVFISLNGLDQTVDAGDTIGEVESTKSVSDLFAPVAGTVATINEALTDEPELANTDPYGDGWMIEIRVSGDSAAALAELLDAAAYGQLISE